MFRVWEISGLYTEKGGENGNYYFNLGILKKWELVFHNKENGKGNGNYYSRVWGSRYSQMFRIRLLSNQAKVNFVG